MGKKKTFWKVAICAAGILVLAARLAVAGPDTWEDLKGKAKKEGEIVILIGVGAGRSLKPAIEEFQKNFGIKTVIHSASGREHADRLLAERRAGIYAADVQFGGGASLSRLASLGVFDPIQDHIVHKEVLDTAKWFQGRHWFGDGDQKHVFAFAGEPRAPILVQYNINRVPKEYVAGIKSLWDWLDPRWAGGQIVSLPPADPGKDPTSAYAHPGLGPEWVRALIELEPFYTTEARVITDGLVKGRFALAIWIGGISRDVERLEEKGFPVATFDVYKRPVKEGFELVAGGVSMMGIINRAKNPNAARLFLNWWLSREGQTAMHEKSGHLGAHYSLREDVPLGRIASHLARKPGAEYTYPGTDPRAIALIQEAFDFEKKVWREVREKKRK